MRIIIFICQVKSLARGRLNDLARSLSKSVMKLKTKLQTPDSPFLVLMAPGPQILACLGPSLLNTSKGASGLELISLQEPGCVAFAHCDTEPVS